MPAAVMLQNPASCETRTVRLAATVAPERIDVQSCTAAQLRERATLLRSGLCLPVGSVEYVRLAMQVAGISEPAFSCYPGRLATYMCERPWRTTLGAALASPKPVFIKPQRVKVFDGFVYNPTGFDLAASAEKWRLVRLDVPKAVQEDAAAYQEHLAGVNKLDPALAVWCAHPCTFASEWRYYLQAGRVLGFARYDDGPDDAPEPNDLDVTSIMADAPVDAICSLDVGVSADGGTWLIELNDAWALGYYRGDSTPTPRAYLGMLWARWQQLVASSGVPGSCGATQR
ncbi:MAG: hypothetical protein K0Q43_38 [Ramlibacter sp.]|nr:hypothetical protein [Ramlibacter sp.]